MATEAEKEDARALAIQNDLHNSGGYIKVVNRNREDLKTFLETGKIRPQKGAVYEAFTEWMSRIKEGKWEAVKLAIEYAVGTPTQVNAESEISPQHPDDFNFRAGDVQQIEQQIKQVTTRVTRVPAES